ncbi:hypothetical protein V8E54_002059 [Elaphomyces granulatus]
MSIMAHHQEEEWASALWSDDTAMAELSAWMDSLPQSVIDSVTQTAAGLSDTALDFGLPGINLAMPVSPTEVAGNWLPSMSDLPDVVDKEILDLEASGHASGDDLVALCEALTACSISDDISEVERRYPLTLLPRKRGAEDEEKSSKRQRPQAGGREKTTKVLPKRHTRKSFRRIRKGNHIRSGMVGDLHGFNWTTITRQTNALEPRFTGEVQAPSISEAQVTYQTDAPELISSREAQMKRVEHVDAACQTDALELRPLGEVQASSRREGQVTYQRDTLELRPSGEAQPSIRKVKMNSRVEYVNAACQTDAPELRLSIKHGKRWQTDASDTSTNAPNKVRQVNIGTSTVRIGDGPKQPPSAEMHEEQQQKKSAEPIVADLPWEPLIWQVILFLVFLFLLGLFLRERQLHWRAYGIVKELTWIETGDDNAGYNHIVKGHGEEFEYRHGIPKEKLPELVKAALKVGLFNGQIQGKSNTTPRPVLALRFYGIPIVVAVTCADNGFVVGINPRTWRVYKKHHGLTEEDIKQDAKWPMTGMSTST